MKILIIAPSMNPVTYKGLGKYSKEMYRRLTSHINVDLIVRSMEEDKLLSTHTEIPFRLLKARKYDLVHALTPEEGIYTPFLCRNTVVTFHDLIPVLASAQLQFRFPTMMTYYTRLAWKFSARAKRVIANSTQTKHELTNALGVPPGKIVVIPLGVDERFEHVRRFKDGHLTAGFFGNFTYRKRADIAIRVFELLSQKIDVRLILAGGRLRTPYQKQFDVIGMSRRISNIKIIHHVRDEDLANLYGSFDLMLFPSCYEGFGLPILEAQRCGVPVLTMNYAKIPQEVRKETVVCGSVEDMAGKALHLFMDSRERRKKSESGKRYASRFTWENTVKKTLEVYRSAL